MRQSVQERELPTKPFSPIHIILTSAASICATEQLWSYSLPVFVPSNHSYAEAIYLGSLNGRDGRTQIKLHLVPGLLKRRKKTPSEGNCVH